MSYFCRLLNRENLITVLWNESLSDCNILIFNKVRLFKDMIKKRILHIFMLLLLAFPVYGQNVNRDPVTYNLLDTICLGDPYLINSTTLTPDTAGIWEYTIPITEDSVVNLQLTVNPTYDITINDTICFGEPYEWGGTVLDSIPVGEYNDTLYLQSQLGCDSTVYLALIINPLSDTLLYDTICHGKDYQLHGFNITKPDIGTFQYTQTVPNQYGCDSIITLELNIYDAGIDSLLFDTICEGESYLINGFNFENPAAGVIYDSLLTSTAEGCDSMVYLTLTIHPRFDIYISASVCDGEDYTENGFNIIQPAVGTYLDTLFFNTYLGCDSILYLDLAVNPNYDTNFNEEICYGENFNGHGFYFERPAVGEHFDTLFLNTIYGCDSIVSIKLKVHELFETPVYDTICHGENYQLHGFDIINPEVGTLNTSITLPSIHGCDSVINLTLEVLPVFDFGDSRIEGYQNTYAMTNVQTGKYEYSIRPIEYCDEYHWEVVDNDKWVVVPDGTKCTLYVTSAGNYDLKVSAWNRCDTTFKTLRITSVFFGVDENSMIEASLFPNPTKNTITVKSEMITGIKITGLLGQMEKVAEYDSEEQVVLDVSDLPAGMHIVFVETKKGNAYKQIIVEK